MKIAIIIIAVCEVIRTIQITLDIVLVEKNRKSANNAFVDSLKKDNKEWAEDLLKDFLKEHKNEQVEN